METLCVGDVEGSGNFIRTTENLIAVRDGLYGAFENAFAAAGIPWLQCEVQDTGDGLFVFAPDYVPKGPFAGDLLSKLAEKLAQHNETHAIGEQIRLRLALNTAVITRDKNGRAFGHGITHTKRLLDSAPLRKALKESLAPLAVIVSSSFYRDIVRQRDEYRPEVYEMVLVEEKETRDFAWVRILNPRPVRHVNP